MKPPIAIVGGGPGGLTLARLLQTANINYVVFERDSSATPTSRFQGGTLDVHPATGQAALARAGLHDQFEALARRHATTMTLQDSRGHHRAVFGEGRDAPEIDRLQLRKMLLGSLSGERVRWGKVLRAAERQRDGPGGVLLRFADGSTESGFRLVVGADGAWSKLRPLITSAKPQYSGTVFIEGRLGHDNAQHAAAQAMVGSGNSLAMGGGHRSLCVQQVADGSYRVYMGLKAPETLVNPGGEADMGDMTRARATMIPRFADWAPHLQAFVAAAEGPWRSWPLYHLPADIFLPDAMADWKRSPGVALLGDAAHVGLPNGEGVNQALFDALVLFRCLMAELDGPGKAENRSQEEDAAAVERAVVAYEADMRPRALEHIQDGLDMDAMIYQENAAQHMAAAFRAMGGTDSSAAGSEARHWK